MQKILEILDEAWEKGKHEAVLNILQEIFRHYCQFCGDKLDGKDCCCMRDD